MNAPVTTFPQPQTTCILLIWPMNHLSLDMVCMVSQDSVGFLYSLVNYTLFYSLYVASPPLPYRENLRGK